MRAATRIYEPTAFHLQVLNGEHSEIRLRYTRLEGEILTGQGMPSIMEAAESLVQVILLHFLHEEQFLEKVSRPILLRQGDANMEMSARLFDIEEGLKLWKPAAVLQLLLLVKGWIYWHMWTENIEYECENLVENRKPFTLPMKPPASARTSQRSR